MKLGSPATVGELLEHAESRMQAAKLVFGHGTDNAFDDACVLLRHAMQLPFDHDLTQTEWARTVGDDAREAFLPLVERRITERLPTPYLTGIAYAQGLAFYTAPNVIVPRSLIGELLANGGIEQWLNNTPKTILDLCTGSGVIAIQAALAFECQTVDAVDISADALALANKNVTLHGLTQRINVLHSDVYGALDGKRYDLIVSNPPYVNADSMAALPAEYLHEPPLALAGGADGMDIVRRIIAQAAQHLNDDGALVIEIGFEATYFEAAFPTLPFVYLPVTAGDDMVVLIYAKDLKTTNKHR